MKTSADNAPLSPLFIQWDDPQITALVSIWTAILTVGVLVAVTPPILLSREILQSVYIQTNPLERTMAAISSTLSVDGSLLITLSLLLGATNHIHIISNHDNTNTEQSAW